jgi:hypothetical protein
MKTDMPLRLNITIFDPATGEKLVLEDAVAVLNFKPRESASAYLRGNTGMLRPDRSICVDSGYSFSISGDLRVVRLLVSPEGISNAPPGD